MDPITPNQQPSDNLANQVSANKNAIKDIVYKISKVELDGQGSASQRKKLITWGIIAVLLLGNIVLGVLYFQQSQQMAKVQKELTQRRTNDKVVQFLNLFVANVINTDQEVSFEKRLQLENAVRDINDPEILDKWDVFIKSTTEQDIQAAVRGLLQVLVKKIAV